MDTLASNRRDPKMTLLRLTQLAGRVHELAWRRSLDVGSVEIAALPGRPEYGRALAPPDDADFHPVEPPYRWPTGNSYTWVRFSVTCPDDWPAADGPLFVRGCLGTDESDWNARNPQGIVLVDGTPVGGLDTRHKQVRLVERPQPGHEYRVEILVWTGMESRPGEMTPLTVSQLDAACDDFAWDLSTALGSAEALDWEDHRRWQLLRACEEAADRLYLVNPVGDDFYDSVGRAHAQLRDALDAMDLPADRPAATLVGHGHLDLGWLWPVGESHFKGLHTLIQQLNLSDELPEHVFLWSQPQSYEWARVDHPDTWQRMKAKAESGNLAVQGAMWVESDTNVPSGESLIRQLLYGTRYVAEHFGHRERLLWLPDVFGYSAALPQLLRQFGIDYFMTTKITWNEYNPFPHDTFHWAGIDGTRVLTHFGAYRKGMGWIAYNADYAPQVAVQGWRDYRSKEVSDRFLVSFGWGDGGGGPDRRQIQHARRTHRMPGLPNTKLAHPLELFDELAESADRYPVWRGELYLELHRGTYTTEGRTKRGNRRCEQALHDAEWLAALAMPLGVAWDKQTLDACWQRLLLLQFHDILPGSSIQTVYEEAEADYAWIAGLAGEIRSRSAEALAAAIDTSAARQPLVLFNPLGHDRRDPVELPAELAGVDVSLRTGDGRLHPSQPVSDPDGRNYRIAATDLAPSLGWSVVDVVEEKADDAGDLSVDGRVLENRWWRLELSDTGRLTRLLDKRAGRDVLAPDAEGNQLQILRDRPRAWPAWDVSYNDRDAIEMILDAERVEVIERGPVRAAVRLHFAFGRSRLVQDVRLYRDIPRIDFDTWCDWHECERLLKAAFPVDVLAPQFTSEIQFGTVDRPTHTNTSWDLAKFEVCAQRWIDLSESGYGVSMLNDCKYGHDVHDNVMRVSLLHGAPRSREEHNLTDQGEHRFCYSLLPHSGDWRQSDTVEAAAELNAPLLAVGAESSDGDLPGWFSFVGSNRERFVVSVVKKCEDDDRLIVRGYEAQGGRGPVTLEFGQPVGQVWKSRADERDENLLDLEDDRFVTFNVRPYEVVTLKVALT